jgi:hypothetical protein
MNKEEFKTHLNRVLLIRSAGSPLSVFHSKIINIGNVNINGDFYLTFSYIGNHVRTDLKTYEIWNGLPDEMSLWVGVNPENGEEIDVADYGFYKCLFEIVPEEELEVLYNTIAIELI